MTEENPNMSEVFLNVQDLKPSRAQLERQLHEARTWQVVWLLTAALAWITAGAVIYINH